MTKLKIYNHPESPVLQLETDLILEITELMDDAGVLYKKLKVDTYVSATYDSEHLQSLYGFLKKEMSLDQLHYCSLVLLEESSAIHDRIRLKYLSEYTLAQQEAYLILDGKYQINLHSDEKVIQLQCEKGDFILIPADIKRWMDIGESGKLIAVKCTEKEEMASIQYTGSNIADRFPRLV